MIITRNCKPNGSIITSGNHFVTGVEAVKQLISRSLRSVVREDPYDRTKGLDYIIIFQHPEMSIRHISDHLLKIPEITNIISIDLNQIDKNELQVSLVIDTIYGAIKYDN